MKMQIKLELVNSNPFRDFDLYPIDTNQVERLRQSINDLGFFSGVTVRRCPTDASLYELAAGHHRIEAAKLQGIDLIDAVVNDYTDGEMVSIMIRENLTQRGYNAASVLDSIAAQCRITSNTVAVAVAANFDEIDEDVRENLRTCGIKNQKSLDTVKGLMFPNGIGEEVLYRAINGFSIPDKDKDAETIKISEVKAALAALKASGKMKQILSDASDLAEQKQRDIEAKSIASEKLKARVSAEIAEKRSAEIEREKQKVKDAENKILKRIGRHQNFV